ncbi:MAG TPA: hypothetical protein VKV19_01775 [Ktedonobacteraceae bacterium]|nr:hypothetical protein [Ktedonobacteraceae bacterium]
MNESERREKQARYEALCAKDDAGERLTEEENQECVQLYWDLYVISVEIHAPFELTEEQGRWVTFMMDDYRLGLPITLWTDRLQRDGITVVSMQLISDTEAEVSLERRDQ